MNIIINFNKIKVDNVLVYDINDRWLAFNNNIKQKDKILDFVKNNHLFIIETSNSEIIKINKIYYITETLSSNRIYLYGEFSILLKQSKKNNFNYRGVISNYSEEIIYENN